MKTTSTIVTFALREIKLHGGFVDGYDLNKFRKELDAEVTQSIKSVTKQLSGMEKRLLGQRDQIDRLMQQLDLKRDAIDALNRRLRATI